MIREILNKLGLGSGLQTQEEPRRRHTRHEGLHADVQVAHYTFGVRDWSMGGMFFETLPDPRLVVGDEVSVTLRFRLPHETLHIKQRARVVRTTPRGIGAEFQDTSAEVRRQFHRVLDGLNASGFVESQTQVA